MRCNHIFPIQKGGGGYFCQNFFGFRRQSHRKQKTKMPFDFLVREAKWSFEGVCVFHTLSITTEGREGLGVLVKPCHTAPAVPCQP